MSYLRVGSVFELSVPLKVEEQEGNMCNQQPLAVSSLLAAGEVMLRTPPPRAHRGGACT